MFRTLTLLLITVFQFVHASQINDARCTICHEYEVKNWEASDHGKAMDYANSSTVLGDFDGVVAQHFSQTAHFLTQDNNYFVSLEENNTTTQYQVVYVFGHYPLQQYLVETKQGEFQVLPFAWDSRSKLEGGQRWYANYQEDIGINDRLHWKQPMQNWNGMCADCHSTGLKRNFDVDSRSFSSHFDTIDVSCASCHGNMADHYPSHDSESSEVNSSKEHSHSSLSPSEQQAIGQWLLKKGDKIAKWQKLENGKYTPAKRDNSFMDTCFGCHSLRSPLTDGINPEHHFLDQFTPSLLISPLYFADGQIKEEVYVYGSFLQSRMYEAGVNCIDCHNPHTMKLKVEGNGLCLQCHSAQAYEGEKHTKHPSDSEASQCVNCHMPTRTYMGVDARRDHSFSIPTPHVSEQTGAPNACLNCHKNDNNWVSKQLNRWYGRDSTLNSDEEKYIAFMHGEGMSKNEVLRLAHAKTLPVIKRATVVTMLPSRIETLSDKDLRPFIRNKEPLLRLAAAQAGRALPTGERLKSFKGLLNDKYKSVRVAAVNNLIGLGIDSAAFQKALDELNASNAINQWRGEGNLNQSLVEYQLGNAQEAEALLKQGIEVDPFFEANYINLAELYRSQNKAKLEKQTLEDAVKAVPTSDIVYYSLGMLNIRQQNKPAAVELFKKASELAPTNTQNWYIYALALDNIGKTHRAITVLKEGLSYVKERRLIELGMSFSQKLGDRNSFAYFRSLANY
ncbi:MULTISPECIES: multiheme c-type cytochrome [unclassified Alteromonas]|uniref:multiheme c-type cytochrome n=1 Tax=unclassified Alteromonas TaxID=2614992 RepID=UPI00192423C5|nr:MULTISPECIES: multiheme c-type cytochrome [unclassified Alteromonas]